MVNLQKFNICLLIHYLCNRHVTLSSTEPFRHMSKIGLVSFRGNTNLTGALWGHLYPLNRGWCIQDTVELKQVSIGILIGLTDPGKTWVTNYYKLIVLSKKVLYEKHL